MFSLHIFITPVSVSSLCLVSVSSSCTILSHLLSSRLNPSRPNRPPFVGPLIQPAFARCCIISPPLHFFFFLLLKRSFLQLVLQPAIAICPMCPRPSLPHLYNTKRIVTPPPTPNPKYHARFHVTAEQKACCGTDTSSTLPSPIPDLIRFLFFALF